MSDDVIMSSREKAKGYSYTSPYNNLPLKVNPIIDDSTLRDGIQMPGLAVSPKHARHIAYLMDAIGVERLEFHQFQVPDQEAIKLIQDLNLKMRLAAWCRAVRADEDPGRADVQVRDGEPRREHALPPPRWHPPGRSLRTQPGVLPRRRGGRARRGTGARPGVGGARRAAARGVRHHGRLAALPRVAGGLPR